jgi:YVTN family beta-propeller protein
MKMGLTISVIVGMIILAAPLSMMGGFKTAEAGLGEPAASFILNDQPGSWFESSQGEIGGTKSLAIVGPSSLIAFTMNSSTVHTVTSLIFPNNATGMPVDQPTGFSGSTFVFLTDPGLYVFTCKIHPYMFGAVIVDDPATTNDDGSAAYDLGEEIKTVNGIVVPTSSDLATRLLRTFFIATNPANWQDFTSSDPWHVEYPPVNVTITGGTIVNMTDVLNARYGNDIDLADLQNPAPGVGQVWVDTQFEKTSGKDKPGTATAVNAETWEVERKVALPEIDMNNPHNMWTDRDQTLIYQTQWFGDHLAVFDRETGDLVRNVLVGQSPAHVMTRTDTDEVHVTLNGEDGIAELSPGAAVFQRVIPMQPPHAPGTPTTNPHAHWMSADGKTMVTPNAFTFDSTMYDFVSDSISSRLDVGALPIATGMMPDSSKYYVANFLDSSISVIDMDTKAVTKTINLLEDYNPVTGEIADGAYPFDDPNNDNDDITAVGALPIQTPVSPHGKFMITANTLTATLMITNTATDSVVKMLGCDAGCHGVQFGAKQGGGYYAYVSSKFANDMIVVDPDPDLNGDASDAAIVGRIALTASNSTAMDDEVSNYAGMGGQGVLPVPLVYNGWVQNLPDSFKSQLTPEQLDPFPVAAIVGGELLGTDMTSLIVAGALMNASWMAPIAGVIAAGIVSYLVTRRLR